MIRFALAGLVATSVATAAVPPTAAAQEPKAQSTEERVKDLYYDGAARYSASDYDGAIEAFTEALKVDTISGAQGSVRGALLQNLAQAHVRAHKIDGDLTHLKTALDIYERFIEEAPAAKYKESDVHDAQTQAAGLRIQLADAQRTTATTTPPDDGQARDPGATSSPAPDTVKTHRTRGIAFTVSGGVLVAAGVVGLAYGPSFRRSAQQQLDKVDDPPAQEREFLDRETQKGRIVMGVGTVAAVVGVGLLAVGIVDLVRYKRSRNVALAPWWTSDGAGMALTGRF